MSILTRALIGATLALALGAPVAAQSVPSGAIPTAGARYDVSMHYAGRWHDVKENVTAANPRAAVANAFAGGYGNIPYDAVSRGYTAKKPFTGIKVYLIGRPRQGEVRTTFHCDLRFRSTTGCKN